MRRTTIPSATAAAAFAACLILTAASSGCGNKAATDEAKMKESMTHPQAFDINKVPPEKRAMVEALMTASKSAGPNRPPVAPKSK